MDRQLFALGMAIANHETILGESCEKTEAATLCATSDTDTARKCMNASPRFRLSFLLESIASNPLTERKELLNMAHKEIIIPGIAADRAWENLQKFPGLLEMVMSNAEIKGNAHELSNKTKALMLTFCQVICFGDSGFPHSDSGQYNGKLGRNEYLAEDCDISLGLVLVEQPVKLVFEGELVQDLVVPFNYCTGSTVVYPLNKIGAKLYNENQLPPHRFMSEHLVPDSSFQPADAVFIGGAIDLESIALILGAEKQDWQTETEPGALIHRIAKDCVDAFNPVKDVVKKTYGQTLTMESLNEKLPTVYAVFSGQGLGNRLARRVGLIQEGRVIDSENGRVDKAERIQHRYSLDLNDLNRIDSDGRAMISDNRRKDILQGWAWFLEVAYPDGNQVLLHQIRAAIS